MRGCEQNISELIELVASTGDYVSVVIGVFAGDKREVLQAENEFDELVQTIDCDSMFQKLSGFKLKEAEKEVEADKMEITITLDELLEIADELLRKWLKEWQEDDGNPLEFDGDVMTCGIEGIGLQNCEIKLMNKEAEKE